MKKSRYYILLIMVVCCSVANAQSDRQSIRDGNSRYHAKDYSKAEVHYRKAIEKNPSNPQALYNLGCALMMQQKDSAAIVQYEKAGQLETNPLRKAKVYHNIGVICQNHQMYQEAITAYQESLRNNPKDDETRYNLALCKQRKKDNQDQNKDQQKDQKKDQNKDQKDNKKKEQQQQENQQMSKENAEQLLNAAIQEEKATQQRMKKAMQTPQKRNLEKNW
ncbi:MAG: tetratricopeptide repeat protein [Prevotella sp.]|nr:tetratricopeptide repeat protein [Prevotella sp.]